MTAFSCLLCFLYHFKDISKCIIEVIVLEFQIIETASVNPLQSLKQKNHDQQVVTYKQATPDVMPLFKKIFDGATHFTPK